MHTGTPAGAGVEDGRKTSQLSEGQRGLAAAMGKVPNPALLLQTLVAKDQKPKSLGEGHIPNIPRAHRKIHCSFFSSRRNNPSAPPAWCWKRFWAWDPVPIPLEVSRLLVRGRCHAHTWLLEIENNSATLENSWAVFYEVKHLLTL